MRVRLKSNPTGHRTQPRIHLSFCVRIVGRHTNMADLLIGCGVVGCRRPGRDSLAASPLGRILLDAERCQLGCTVVVISADVNVAIVASAERVVTNRLVICRSSHTCTDLDGLARARYLKRQLETDKAESVIAPSPIE
jgi:hypothetical protein